jgi:N6-adenosine-specific RNA methylase IME4
MPNELALLDNFDRAKVLIAQADLAEAIDWVNKGEALRVYAAKAKKGHEIQNQCAEIKLRAERRAGEILAEIERSAGERTDLTSSSTDEVPTYSKVLQDNKLAFATADRWQLESKVPEEAFTEFLHKTNTEVREITSAGLRRFAIRQKFGDNGDIPPLPEGIFNVIYADPPWRYENILPEWGPAQLHYPTMTLERLCALEIPAASDAVLFLWVTNPFLRSALELVDAWGFEYKTNMVWVKTHLKYPGSGFYIRGRHELLFICTKGSFVPDQTGKEPIGSVIEAPVREHSQKPAVVYDTIEKMYPQGRYLELFARNRRKGWKSWGNEIEERQRQVAGG